MNKIEIKCSETLVQGLRANRINKIYSNNIFFQRVDNFFEKDNVAGISQGLYISRRVKMCLY